MDKKTALRLDSLEEAVRELQSLIEELRDGEEEEAAPVDITLEQVYSSVSNASFTISMPWWVRDMFLETCSDIFASKSGERFYRKDITVAHAIRFLVCYAIKNPEAIEYVSLDELRKMKNKIDNH